LLRIPEEWREDLRDMTNEARMMLRERGYIYIGFNEVISKTT
jgi:hypothetical protein